ncbi:MAG TPA: NAD(P)/FAD-dependent oxidoreductase, partial [Chthoniobacterales bacterium]
MVSNGKHVVIMGAGPAGLTAAYQLTKAGVSCTVLEKDDVVGGLSRTACYKDYRFDIGGHRFFTKIPAVNQMWREVLSRADFLRCNRLSRIYYKRKFFSYPLKVRNVVAGLGIWDTAAILASYVKIRLFPIKPEKTFEAWVSNRFGRRLYRTFFKSYTEKVWGMPCSEISADWAAQRIKDLSLWSAMMNAIWGGRKSGKKKVIRTLIDSFDYPRLGPGMMWEAVLELISNNGCAVSLGSPVEKIRWEDDVVIAVEVKSNGANRVVPGSHFMSTLPIRELFEKLDPSPPAAVVAAARKLRYRDFITVALIVNKQDLFPDNWIYIHEPGLKVGRIQNFKNWSAEMVPDPTKTCVGLEYFCHEGDGLWSMADSELIALARIELSALGLASEKDIFDGKVVRMPKAYPVYDADYRDALRKVREFLQSIPNLQLIGRNGMHKYNNQDHSMLTAMLATRNVLGENHDLWAVNETDDHHEDGTSIDETTDTAT